MRALALALALVVACAAPAWAAPAYVQGNAPTCSSVTTCTLAGSPTNGNIVVWVVPNTASVGSVTVKDSNGVSLVEHQPANNCIAGNALCVGIFDYVVSGSPTNTYTLSGVTAYDSACATTALGGEISGAAYNLATYSAAQAVATSAAVVATLSTVAIKDFQAGVTACSLSSGSGLSVTALSNGTPATFGVNIAGKYALATSTASSTVTTQYSVSFTGVVAYVDYPAPLTGAAGSGQQWIGAYDPVFALMLELV